VETVVPLDGAGRPDSGAARSIAAGDIVTIHTEEATLEDVFVMYRREGTARVNGGVISAILRKDLVAFSRDRFYVFITVLGLAAFVAMYWLLPSSVDETVRLGVSHTNLGQVLGPMTAAESEALAIFEFDSREELLSRSRGWHRRD
jgi:hypothetical protein